MGDLDKRLERLADYAAESRSTSGNDEALKKISDDLRSLAIETRRVPGLPTNKSATAIGYTKDGQPFMLRFVETPTMGAFERGLDGWWAASGFIDTAVGPAPFHVMLHEQRASVVPTIEIVEHEIIEVG